MHTHACPLYALAKLMGLEFTETGVNLAPKLPLASFRFESPLLGVVKSEHGYEGWYNPATRSMYSIHFKLAAEEAKQFSRVEVNSKKINARMADGGFEMRGEGGGGTALHWSVSS
jgi:hypothetical protein